MTAYEAQTVRKGDRVIYPYGGRNQICVVVDLKQWRGGHLRFKLDSGRWISSRALRLLSDA